jgi:hypothetical protein
MEEVKETVPDVVVKRKKGRPRKETTPQTDVPKPPEEKKKRGRKKKEVVVEEVKQKKKRGRKAAVKYFSSSIRKKIPLTTVLQDNNNYILHLDVKDDENTEAQKSEGFEIDAVNETQVTKRSETENADIPSIVNSVFEKLKTENDANINQLQKEYDELLEKEDAILSQIFDNEDDLTELYEKRLEYREHQDSVLINKLEVIHKDNNIVDKIFSNEFATEELKSECVNDCQEQNRKKGFFELLRPFVDNETWLHNTDVCCWWCCHTFESVPLGLPVKYDELKKKFQVKGVFCSFSCMIAHNRSGKRNNTQEYLIKFLYNKLTGTILNDMNLEPAPPRCSLKMFGGELTIEEFRNSFKENKVYKMIEYPMFVCKDYIEEVDIQNVKRVNRNVFSETQHRVSNLDDKRIEDAKIRLSQIERTTITLGNTIDKFIKIS